MSRWAAGGLSALPFLPDFGRCPRGRALAALPARPAMRSPAPATLGLLLLGLLLLPGEAAQKPTPCQSCRELVDKFYQVGWWRGTRSWGRGTRSQGQPTLDPGPPYGLGSPQHGRVRWSLTPMLSPQGMVDTAKKNFGGGTTAWEEKSLSKYEFRWAPSLLEPLGFPVSIVTHVHDKHRRSLQRGHLFSGLGPTRWPLTGLLAPLPHSRLGGLSKMHPGPRVPPTRTVGGSPSVWSCGVLPTSGASLGTPPHRPSP